MARYGRQKRELTENEIAKIVVDAAFKIHTRYGPGLLESAYQAMLEHELEKRGLDVLCEQPIRLLYDGKDLGIGYRADMIVNDKVIIELKSVENTIPIYKKQLLTYLRVADKRLGLLINFGSRLIKDGISRVANGL